MSRTHPHSPRDRAQLGPLVTCKFWWVGAGDPPVLLPPKTSSVCKFPLLIKAATRPHGGAAPFFRPLLGCIPAEQHAQENKLVAEGQTLYDSTYEVRGIVKFTKTESRMGGARGRGGGVSV